MFQKVLHFLGIDPVKREVMKLAGVVDEINALEPSFEALTDEDLRAKTEEFRRRLADGETLDEILPQAFAAVREASKRTIGLRHYDVQLMGGQTLHQGKIAEMRTGEGKTLVATLPVYLNAITARGVHLITVNDYLARRDARWMTPIYQALGLTVGVLQMASRTENGKKAFLVDLDKTSPFEDQHQLRLVDRVEAYKADITYGTNSEFGFDYLRDNLANRPGDRVQRGHYFAIVDEVDNILIDEARTPLIISGPAADEAEWYIRMAQVVRQLQPEHYEISERDHTVTLTEVGETKVEEILQTTLRDPDRPEDITPEQARILGYLEQALRAQHLYRRNKDYIVQSGKVVIVDEFTGRLMPGRRWSEGLHQAVEAKEGVKVEPENVTYATITIQNYFRMYEKLAGMTGTAATESEEFDKIYKLAVLPVPTNLEFRSLSEKADLIEVDAKDDQGYKYTYFAHKNDPARKPVFYRRKDYPDVVYRTEEAKRRAITQEIIRFYVLGRPQLVGTTSVEHSEILSMRLTAEPVRRLLQTILVREAWRKAKNKEYIETTIPELAFLNQNLNDLNAGELRQAAKVYGVTSINPEDPANLTTLLSYLTLRPEDSPRLIQVIRAGVPHKVLNARKHDEEANIIAEAGAFGAVTIATNMAGRGVDIKLGGVLDETHLINVKRVLNRSSIEPFDMNNEELFSALKQIDPGQFGIYEESVRSFMTYVENMERVRELGGLHVIGSERHEARRIDNQLRGRSSRQGDPGSSRFYLSLEDELMRLFGGAQVEGLLKRLNIDESMPIEMGMVGRLVEQAQGRVEGSNFDVRKHLLEYDDVLNTQRKRIYGQRDKVFQKGDLSEDVLDMLDTELKRRVSEAYQDEEGPWKLLAFLDDVQPVLSYDDISYPSFTMRILMDEIVARLPEKTRTRDDLRNTLLDIAREALDMERHHVLKATRAMLEKTEENLDAQKKERYEALDTFLEGLPDRLEEQPAPRPQSLVDELSVVIRIPIKTSTEIFRQISEGNQDLKDSIRQQIDAFLMGITASRLVGMLDRRLEDASLKINQFQNLDWQDAADLVLSSVETAYDLRTERLLGDNGQIVRDLEAGMETARDAVWHPHNLLAFLGLMTQGARLTFDARTHRRGMKKFVRLNYFYLAAHLLGRRDEDKVQKQIKEHLEGARKAQMVIWGRVEYARLRSTNASFGQMDERLREQLRERFGADRLLELNDKPVTELVPQDIGPLVETLGVRMINEIYREVLLRAISSLWVDYLTRVEGLRASIGLEAYAQRDPLVMYKGKASEMFSELLRDIRIATVNGMFTGVPSRSASAIASADRSGQPAEETAAEDDKQPSASAENEERRKKRKRH